MGAVVRNAMMAEFYRMSFWHRWQNRFLRKCLILSVCLSFVFPAITWAFSPENFATPAGLDTADASAIAIPDKWGEITQSFQGQGPLVVHIQDLHCNYEVQNNIAHLLDFLARKHGIKLVCIEGASQPVNTTKLSSFPDEKIKRSVGDAFMRLGQISGAEFYAATGQQAIDLVGIENADHYCQGRKYLETFFNHESLGLLEDLRLALAETQAALGAQPEQMLFNRFEQELGLAEKMLNISVTPGELAAYREQTALHPLPELKAFLLKHHPAKAHELASGLDGMEKYLKQAEAFYANADLRSTDFAQNVLAQIKDGRAPAAVVITGGYHTSQLLAQFKANKVSFVSIKPSLTRPEAGNPYFSLLQKRQTSLQKRLAVTPGAYALEVFFAQCSQTRDRLLAAQLPEDVRAAYGLLELALKLELVHALIEKGFRELEPLRAELADEMVKYQDEAEGLVFPESILEENSAQIKIAGRDFFGVVCPAGESERLSAEGLFTLPIGDHELAFFDNSQWEQVASRLGGSLLEQSAQGRTMQHILSLAFPIAARAGLEVRGSRAVRAWLANFIASVGAFLAGLIRIGDAIIAWVLPVSRKIAVTAKHLQQAAANDTVPITLARFEPEQAGELEAWSSNEIGAWKDRWLQSSGSDESLWQELGSIQPAVRRQVFISCLDANEALAVKQFRKFQVDFTYLLTMSAEQQHDLNNIVTVLFNLASINTTDQDLLDFIKAYQRFETAWKTAHVTLKQLKEAESIPDTLQDAVVQALENKASDKQERTREIKQIMAVIAFRKLGEALTFATEEYRLIYPRLSQISREYSLDSNTQGNIAVIRENYALALMAADCLAPEEVFQLPLADSERVEVNVLHQLVQKYFEQLSKEPMGVHRRIPVELEFEQTGEKWILGTYGKVFSTVLRNPISNSIRATDRQAENMEPVEKDRFLNSAASRITLYLSANGARVRDHGVGLSSKIAPRLGERGVTEGTGKGLGVYNLKQAMRRFGMRAFYVSKSIQGWGTSVILRYASVPTRKVTAAARAKRDQYQLALAEGRVFQKTASQPIFNLGILPAVGLLLLAVFCFGDTHWLTYVAWLLPAYFLYRLPTVIGYFKPAGQPYDLKALQQDWELLAEIAPDLFPHDWLPWIQGEPVDLPAQLKKLSLGTINISPWRLLLVGGVSSRFQHNRKGLRLEFPRNFAGLGQTRRLSVLGHETLHLVHHLTAKKPGTGMADWIKEEISVFWSEFHLNLAIRVRPMIERQEKWLISPATWLLASMNTVIYYLQTKYTQSFVWNYLPLNTTNVFQQHHYWQLFTYLFVHNNWLHLITNLIALISLGQWLEKIMGSKFFMFFYLASGVGAGLVTVIAAWTTQAPVLLFGASGAIIGLLVAYGLFFAEQSGGFFLMPAKMKAKYVVLFAVGLETAMVVFEHMISHDPFWSHWAHIGGILGGYLFFLLGGAELGAYLAKPSNPYSPPYQSKPKSSKTRQPIFNLGLAAALAGALLDLGLWAGGIHSGLGWGTGLSMLLLVYFAYRLPLMREYFNRAKAPYGLEDLRQDLCKLSGVRMKIPLPASWLPWLESGREEDLPLELQNLTFETIRTSPWRVLFFFGLGSYYQASPRGPVLGFHKSLPGFKNEQRRLQVVAHEITHLLLEQQTLGQEAAWWQAIPGLSWLVEEAQVFSAEWKIKNELKTRENPRRMQYSPLCSA